MSTLATEDTARDDAAPGARPFWLYWAATATSNLGSAVTVVAMPLVAVTVLDAGPVQTGVLAAASYAAWIVLGLPAGAIVHRLPLRAVQVACDVVRAVVLLSVPVAAWTGHLTLWHLVVVALLLNAAEVLFFTANTTFLPAVVPRDQLTSRNSLISGTHAVSQLGGPSLGGVLVQAAGAAGALLADAVSYVASAVLLSRLPERRQPAGDGPASMRAQIAAGLRFVMRHPVMAPATWWAVVTNAVCGAQLALFTVYLVRELDTPPVMVGILLAVEGAGALAAAAITPWLVRRFGSARIILYDGVAGFLAALLIPAGTGHLGWACFALGNLLFAATVVPGSVVTRTYRQVASPPEMLSRVMATVRFVSWGAIPLGGLAAGAVAEAAGTRTVLLASAFVLLLAPAIVWFSPVRHLRDLEDLPTRAVVEARPDR
ncbi:MFS transporter [Myceligenerans pegani]|uniref:MFS transporter n=1 Tax=Myceligenerans pegani TaxID=2776917 RepID=A0ABR9N577_9MICO|nr:MFS transporter [Myceligenerans sp. TRM 65318]MBE1878274.1 MFS transporter [Myceligenerans sp. TRM 65318]MBE3020545.1 MFS transporter [Myceligenerans sp. TRM 65318]